MARVLGAARYRAEGHLGLVAVPGGFAAPGTDGPLAVVGIALTDGRRRQPLTTLRAACAFAGVDPEAPTHEVLALPERLDDPLTLDATGAGVVADWMALTATALAALAAGCGPADDPSAAQLWPEHFDLALEAGPPGARANYGGSPGAATLPEPYLYVGPPEPRVGPFWTAPFGAVLTYGEVAAGAEPAGFYARGRALLGP